MGLRITTWNVNGIRNPFGYQPWREKRSFEAMFKILDADIVVMQELKIQRKDLRDDMVLVPGWDCYFSLPKHKKGYSGVAIYISQAKCCPIRAEEGVLGQLCPPNSRIPYYELPADKHIGGYLSDAQLADVGIDPSLLDSEGRCVVLEFPLFVLFGIYSPANSSGLRDDFRHAFLNALDKRLRNLVALGKRVVVAGDLNVSRDLMDTAKAEESMRKEGLTYEDYMSTPNRRIFNQLIKGGVVIGQRDEGRENSIVCDICRVFHPVRRGMYTHWEQKINARPGNFGSRIDFILASLDMEPWFIESDIQEGLMGSDHCPVYAVLADKIKIEDTSVSILDCLNPVGHFQGGTRKTEYSVKSLPSISAKLLPEFQKRRTIEDMFGIRLASPSTRPSGKDDYITASDNSTAWNRFTRGSSSPTAIASSSRTAMQKRASIDDSPSKSFKKAKLGSCKTIEDLPKTSQQSLKGFFKSNAAHEFSGTSNEELGKFKSAKHKKSSTEKHQNFGISSPTDQGGSTIISDTNLIQPEEAQEFFIDPIESKQSWDKLFSRSIGPKCEGHGETCKLMKTKKPGFNYGREFWMCSRPLGPTGAKERNTEWRCHTFKWCSDWNSNN